MLNHKRLSLRERRQGVRRFFPAALKQRQAEIIEAVEPRLMEAEILSLPPEHILFQNDDYLTALAKGDDIPLTMVEISRLRELTFRAAGEGTGECRDTDAFDRYYTQLFIWNRKQKEIVGAYRLAKTDETMAAEGLEGLYSSTLFSIRPQFFECLGPALELGRSFVRQEYQKDYEPLYLLWKGIGAYVMQNPRYKTLFGLVSISNDYKAISRQLMAAFYGRGAREHRLTRLVAPRCAFPVPKRAEQLSETLLKTERDLNTVLSDIEGGVTAPVLLRHYRKLGGLIVNFSLDPSFSETLVGLIVVDLSQTATKYLERYLGAEGSRQFKARHCAEAERPAVFPAGSVDSALMLSA